MAPIAAKPSTIEYPVYGVAGKYLTCGWGGGGGGCGWFNFLLSSFIWFLNWLIISLFALLLSLKFFFCSSKSLLYCCVSFSIWSLISFFFDK